MSEEKSEIELSEWSSTYGVITAERIFGRYQIKLTQAELLPAIKNHKSFYHKLLEVPLRNVLNGIVLQQANEYHIYAQKLFIDYLLSGENVKDAASQGGGTREALEEERQQLVKLGEGYSIVERNHNNLIADSQATIIKITRNFNAVFEKTINSMNSVLRDIGLTDAKSKVRQAIIHALSQCAAQELQNDPLIFVKKMNEILNNAFSETMHYQIQKNTEELISIVLGFNEEIRGFVDDVETMRIEANSFRTQFHDAIVRILDLIKLLPEYKIDPHQDEINREPLYFDKSIGAME